MKYQLCLLLLQLLLAPFILLAQTDTTKSDTTYIMRGRAKIIFIEKNGEKKAQSVQISSKKKNDKRSNVETDWLGFDWGFSNFRDQTNYINPAVSPIDITNREQRFLSYTTAADYELNTGKSMNFNFSIFKQQISLYKHHVNLVYGLSYDINNWRYRKPIQWNVETAPVAGVPNAYTGSNISLDSLSRKKNKLVTNYIQVPLMLKFESHPEKLKRNLTLAVGGFAGYLVRSHTKSIQSGSDKKEKEFDSFNLTKFQYGGLIELGFRGITVYYKHHLTPITEYGTQHYPFSFGIRISGS